MVAIDYTQIAAAHPNNVNHARQGLAISLLCAINTAELTYKFEHGVYSTWDTLVANGDFTSNGTKWGATERSAIRGCDIFKWL